MTDLQIRLNVSDTSSLVLVLVPLDRADLPFFISKMEAQLARTTETEVASDAAGMRLRRVVLDGCVALFFAAGLLPLLF